MAWPERIVLGVIGRRPDDLALAWALGIARRWSSELHVIVGYHPPVGMFPHIVTVRAYAEHRDAAHRKLARQIEASLDPGLVPGSAAPRLTLVPEPQLDHTLVACSREADLLLLGLSPALPLLSRRQLARAQRIAERARCPADLGPDRTVGDTVRT